MEGISEAEDIIPSVTLNTVISAENILAVRIRIMPCWGLLTAMAIQSLLIIPHGKSIQGIPI
ncbi:hypothetical protein D3C75_1154810 [compost metagenome]